MTPELFERLLYEEEGTTIDFKKEQYRFVKATDEEKSELLKDILGFANAFRRSATYILIGVEEVRGGRSNVLGIDAADQLDDHAVQQFVNNLVNTQEWMSGHRETEVRRRTLPAQLPGEPRLPSSKTRRMGSLSQQGCQQTRRRQRRNWRVRAVERGQLSEPAWLRAHPGLHYFEPEKPPRTQIPRNVWDTGTAGTGAGVNYNSQRNLAKRKLAQSPPDKLRFTDNLKLLINKLVTCVSSPSRPPSSQFRPGRHSCYCGRKEMP